MTISKSEIFKGVLTELGAHGGKVTSIDEVLRDVFYDLSARGLFIPYSDTITTVDGTAKYAFPVSTMASLLDVSISNNGQIRKIRYHEYQELIQEESSLSEGEPIEYAIFNEFFYFYPAADAVYTINLAGFKYHDNSLATVEFNEIFRRVIKDGVLSLIWAGVLKNVEGSGQMADRAKILFERGSSELMNTFNQHRNTASGRAKFNDV